MKSYIVESNFIDTFHKKTLVFNLWSSKTFLSLQSNISVGIMNRKLEAKDEILKIHIAG